MIKGINKYGNTSAAGFNKVCTIQLWHLFPGIPAFHAEWNPGVFKNFNPILFLFSLLVFVDYLKL